jgi:4-amino-4-deoxy-L-arabinose transferase-like glycosyltransferase
VCLAGILLGAAGLALVWVFLVPIFQAPDEDTHLDYALCIHDRGSLLVGRHFPTVVDLGDCVHPYTLYLRERAFTGPMLHDEVPGMPADYGTPAFFQAIDRDAPPPDRVQFSDGPFLLRAYPFGYYTLLAAWLRLVGACHGGVTVQFFAARILSVLLLVCSLLLTFATARELRLRPATALLLTAVIGFLPLTTFVASYVQPDNLSFTLVSLCFYLGLRARRRPEPGWRLALLGLAFGALVVTKVHFAVCVAVPVLAMLAVEARGRSLPAKKWLTGAALLTLPALVLTAVYLWTVWGTTNYMARPDMPSSNQPLPVKVVAAFRDYYVGPTHRSFWGNFGWLDVPLVIGPAPVNEGVKFVIRTLTWLVLALTLWRLCKVVWRLARVSWRGRWRQGLRVACANPVLNSFFLFTIAMFYMYVRLDNAFGAQGRNWFPFLLPIFLTPLVYAPKALRAPRARALLRTVVAAGLILYAPVGGYFAIQAIHQRYYAHPAAATAAAAGVAQDTADDRGLR